MTFLETNVGPVIGETSQLIDLLLKARNAVITPDEEVRLADFMTWGLHNTPYVNLFYTKTALDYLFINSMRETASPGYLRRVAKRQKEDYDLELYFKDHLKPFGK